MLGRDLAEVKAQGATAFTLDDVNAGSEILNVKNLSVGHRVNNVSLSIKKGEIVGLAGLLGSGRTETARAIFAADRLRGGQIEFNGASHAFKQPGQTIAAGMGFCSEDRKVEGIIPDMSVAENLTLALLPALVRSGMIDVDKQKVIVNRFIRELGIKCTGPNQKIRELSGGNQQKVLLARWLCMNPKLLILDEPTRGIDVGAKAEIQNLIHKLALSGLGVLMISSELEEIIEGANRVFVLREGQMVAEFSHEDVTEKAVMGVMAHGIENSQNA